MPKIDLITGFLGSGKTTFIRRYARCLARHGERVGIIENDYGAINVDMMLLNDLKEEGIGLEMVAGGCDYDCHRRRFRTKLITMALLGYDRVIVEPSGIFDVDEFFDLLQEDDLYDRYTIDNVLAIVDASLNDEMSDQADYMLASQIACCGKVIFSFVKETGPEKTERTIAHIREALQKVSCRRIFSNSEFYAKDRDDMTDEDYLLLAKSGYRETGFVKKYAIDDAGFESLFFMNTSLSRDEILAAVEKIWKDEKCGRVMRIKGFIPEGEGWLELNSTHFDTDLRPISAGQEILIVIGEQLNAEHIDEYFPSEFSTIRTQ